MLPPAFSRTLPAALAALSVLAAAPALAQAPAVTGGGGMSWLDLLAVDSALSLLRLAVGIVALLAMLALGGLWLGRSITARDSLALPLQAAAYAPPLLLALPLGRMLWAADAGLWLPVLLALVVLPLPLQALRRGRGVAALPPALLLLWTAQWLAEMTAGAGGLGQFAATQLQAISQGDLALAQQAALRLVVVGLAASCLVPLLLRAAAAGLARLWRRLLPTVLSLQPVQPLPPARSTNGMLRHLMLPPPRLALADLLPLLPILLAMLLPVSGLPGAPRFAFDLPSGAGVLALSAVSVLWASLQRERSAVTALLLAGSAAGLMTVAANAMLRDAVEGASAPGFWCLLLAGPLLLLRAMHHLAFERHLSRGGRRIVGLLLWGALGLGWWWLAPDAALLPRAVLPSLAEVLYPLGTLWPDLQAALTVTLQQRAAFGLLLGLGLTLVLRLASRREDAGSAAARPRAAMHLAALEPMLLALIALPVLTAVALLSPTAAEVLTLLLIPLWVATVASLGMTAVLPWLQQRLGGRLGIAGMLQLLAHAAPWAFAAAAVAEFCAAQAGLLPPAMNLHVPDGGPDAVSPQDRALAGIGGFVAIALLGEDTGFAAPVQVFTEVALAALLLFGAAFWVVALLLRVRPPEGAEDGRGEALPIAAEAPAAAS